MANASLRTKTVYLVVSTKVNRGFTEVNFELFSNLMKAQLYQAEQERKGYRADWKRRVIK